MQHHYSGHWKGWALKISTFLHPNGTHLDRAISGPKKVLGPTPSNAPCTGILIVIMYRRPILCTLYGTVDFLNVLKKGCWWGGGVLLVHSEINYVPVDDGWEEVLLRNVLHYIPISAITHLVYLLDRSCCKEPES